MSSFKETSNLGKYLGVPLTGKTPRHKDSSYLMDNVKAKLSNWKAKHLSFVGLHDWITMNMHINFGYGSLEEWKLLWATTCHTLLHEDNYGMHVVLSDDIRNSWKPPREGWILTNIDGVAKNNGKVSCGGLILDTLGWWLGGFSKNIGV
ncbi:hypothetical protein KIW84_021237 [Lathyrus oleraceus]|uniref:RNA-directed DNA polymerase (Reverse transcriptase) n=1 Tax=Pisum sativum TaxID=3888 RepID=A0A9D4Y9A3_PEA|nr:hypothetical protein KIW84_021237 [Pisum sativum]